jgi:ABC-2 type transport system permease protein
MSTFKLILEREFMTRIKKKSFGASIIIAILVLLGYVYIPVIITAISGSSQTKIAVVNQTGQNNLGGIQLNTFLDDYLNTTVITQGGTVTTSKPKKPPYLLTFNNPEEIESLRNQVRDGKINGVLSIARNGGGELEFSYFTRDGNRGTSTQRISDAATRLTIADRLGRAGVPPNVTTTPAMFKVTDTEVERSQNKGIATDESQLIAAYGVVVILIIALFISINAYGSIIAQGVAEEKSNRVMEIIISAAKPEQLMFGKVFGIGLLGIVSIVIIAILAVPAIMLQGPITEALVGDASSNSFNLSGFNLGTLAYFLIFYLGGYFLYGMLYAAAGSLCTRTEDVQQTLAPLTTILMIAYFIGLFGLQAIDAPWVIALSYVPFFSPILMFARIGFGTVAPFEIVISIILLFAGVLACGWIAARIYRTGVLLYGKRPSFLQAIGLGRVNK